MMPSKYGGSHKPQQEAEPLVHPIWRGVGFAFMVLAPIMSYLLVEIFLDLNKQSNWLAIPKNLIVNWPQDPLILVKLIGVVILSIVLLSVFQLIYFILMRFLAPKRPMEAPRSPYRN